VLTLTLHNDFMVNLAAAVHLLSKSLSSVFKQATECKSLIYCRRSLVVIRSIASFVWRTCSHMHHFQVAFLALPTLVHPGLFQSVVSAHLVRKVAISYMWLHAVCHKNSVTRNIVSGSTVCVLFVIIFFQWWLFCYVIVLCVRFTTICYSFECKCIVDVCSVWCVCFMTYILLVCCRTVTVILVQVLLSVSSETVLVVVHGIVHPELLDLVLHFLFHFRILVQTQEINSFVLHISSLRYHSAQELLVCLTLQRLLATFQEDCVQDVRRKSSYIGIVRLFAA